MAQSLKEIAIRNYISKVDFTSEDWSVDKIREEMRRFLGEEPGVDIVYKKDVMINEFMGETKEIIRLKKIDIVYTDLDDKYKKITFQLD